MHELKCVVHGHFTHGMNVICADCYRNMEELINHWKSRFEDQNNLIEDIHRLYMDTAFETGKSEDLYNFLDKLRDILDSEK